MPNWCSSFITITSDDEKNIKPIKDFLNKKDSGVWLMDGLVPFKNYKNKISDLDHVFHMKGFSDFTTVYGTKWDLELNDPNFYLVNNEDDYISFSTETAWSPPIGFCKLLSEKYKVNVEIIYSEPGSDIAGKHYFEGGISKYSKDTDYVQGLYMFDKDNFIEHFEDSYIEEYEQCNDGRGNKYSMGMFLEDFYSYMSKEEKEYYINKFYKN